MSGQPIPRWLGIALLLVIATVFGSNHVAARLAFEHGANVTTAVACRSAGTALFVLALLAWSGISLRVERGTLARAIVIGLFLALQSYCLYSAVARIPMAGFAGRWAEVGAGVLWASGASVSFAMVLYLTTRWLGGMDGRLRSFFIMSVVAAVTIAGAFIVVGAIAWLGSGNK